MPRSKAYVSGSGGLYRLILPDALPADARAEFINFDRAFFTRYHAARLLARAVNEYAARYARAAGV